MSFNLNNLLSQKKPVIMGILNVTPDSFSDGGKYNSIDTAVEHALKMEAEGADIIDIGGESSGPGSQDISVEEELKRVIPIIKAIREKSNIPISVDTYKSEVAEAALKAGADMINDVTGLRGDDKLASVIAQHNCPVVIMYSKDNSARTTIQEKTYDDVIATISTFLQDRIDYAVSQGIDQKNIVIDPGMGHFVSALPRYSFEIISRLNELKKLGHPNLIGISRKSLLGGKLEDRDAKGPALEAIAFLNGSGIIRTHNVANSKAFFDTSL